MFDHFIRYSKRTYLIRYSKGHKKGNKYLHFDKRVQRKMIVPISIFDVMHSVRGARIQVQFGRRLLALLSCLPVRKENLE